MCAICRRDARGYGFASALVRVDAPNVKLCSWRCQRIAARLKGMIDPNKHEVNALAAASQQAGVYVEALGRTDLVSWTASEWDGLVEVIVTAFQDYLRQAYQDDPPF